MTASANNVTVPGDTRLNDLKVNRKAPFWAKIPIIKELRVAVGWQKGMLITGLLLTAFFLLVALFAPVIAPYGYAQLKDANGVSFPAQAAPSSEHIWGTTAGGYDVFSRVIWGSRTAVIAIVIAVLLSIFAGVLLGLVSGYFGGWVDRVLVMIADAIKAATEELAKASHKLAEQLYQQQAPNGGAQQQPGAGANPGAGAAQGNNNDDVVDADFTEVK